MARITFWSPDATMSGNTHAAIAVSTLMGITHKTSSILMQGNFNSRKIESAFTPYDMLKTSGVFENSNMGLNALIRLVTSNKLTADGIQNYAKPVLKGRLDVLYGLNSKDEEDYIALETNLSYITRKAAELYDLVFLDSPKSKDNKAVLNTLLESEIVICIVNQNSVKLDDFFEKVNSIEQLKNKEKIIIVADYDSNSKYNVSNIKRKYKVKDLLYVLPHNHQFSDSCNDGNVVDFFYKNLNANPKDPNGFFIAQVREIVERIMGITKIKDV